MLAAAPAAWSGRSEENRSGREKAGAELAAREDAARHRYGLRATVMRGLLRVSRGVTKSHIDQIQRHQSMNFPGKPELPPSCGTFRLWMVVV